jgi:hypothetical protein
VIPLKISLIRSYSHAPRRWILDSLQKLSGTPLHAFLSRFQAFNPSDNVVGQDDRSDQRNVGIPGIDITVASRGGMLLEICAKRYASLASNSLQSFSTEFLAKTAQQPHRRHIDSRHEFHGFTRSYPSSLTLNAQDINRPKRTIVAPRPPPPLPCSCTQNTRREGSAGSPGLRGYP